MQSSTIVRISKRAYKALYFPTSMRTLPEITMLYTRSITLIKESLIYAPTYTAEAVKHAELRFWNLKTTG
jgi:hypothetical protein